MLRWSKAIPWFSCFEYGPIGRIEIPPWRGQIVTIVDDGARDERVCVLETLGADTKKEQWRGQRKAQRSSQREIDEFEENNGISIRAFKATCQYYPKPVEIQLDARKSAFGATIAIDPEFVPCRREPQERVHKQRKAKEPQKNQHTRKHHEAVPVDFVYDIDTRKQLREALDKERIELLQQTKEREKALRDANLWLFDRRGENKKHSHKTPKKQTKECWQEHIDQQVKEDDMIWSTKPKSSKKKSRASMTNGKRNSVAENVHRYEIQTHAYHQDEDITIERRTR